MNRADALAAATAIVDKATQPVMNERGYKADGWKPPTLAERTEAIIKLAEFLMLPEPPEPHGRELDPGRSTVFGWPIDGLDGPPSYRQYQAALGTQEHWKTGPPNQLHLAAEIDAVNHLVWTYREAHPLCPSCQQPKSEFPRDACDTPTEHDKPMGPQVLTQASGLAVRPPV